MDNVVAAAIFLGVVVVLFVGGVRIGMLLAPRIGRLMEVDDEEPGDPDD